MLYKQAAFIRVLHASFLPADLPFYIYSDGIGESCTLLQCLLQTSFVPLPLSLLHLADLLFVKYSMTILCSFGALALFVLFYPGTAIVWSTDDLSSMREAAALAAHGVQALYRGNQSGEVVGKWPFPPYYWWESGGAWGGMLQYWHATGDSSYNQVLMEALTSQLGPN